MSNSSPPDALPAGSNLSHDDVLENPGPGPPDVMPPGPVLALDTVPEVSSPSFFDVVPLNSSSAQDMMLIPSPARDGMIVASGPRSPDVVPLDEVPSFRTVDPLRSPPPTFDEVPPTPPGYRETPPPPPPPPPPTPIDLPPLGGTRRFNFTFPTWQEIQAAFDRFRFRGRANGVGGDADPGTKGRKRDRAKKVAKGCWRKLGLGRREDRDDEDTQAPEQASSVVVVPVVVHKK